MWCTFPEENRSGVLLGDAACSGSLPALDGDGWTGRDPQRGVQDRRGEVAQPVGVADDRQQGGGHRGGGDDGESRSPRNGYRTRAVMGMPTAL